MGGSTLSNFWSKGSVTRNPYLSLGTFSSLSTTRHTNGVLSQRFFPFGSTSGHQRDSTPLPRRSVASDYTDLNRLVLRVFFFQHDPRETSKRVSRGTHRWTLDYSCTHIPLMGPDSLLVTFSSLRCSKSRVLPRPLSRTRVDGLNVLEC